MPTLEQLWDSTAAFLTVRSSDPAGLSALPNEVRRYLKRAIAAEAPLASAVRLRMHGEIRLRGLHPFVAEQVISWDRGMIWQATAHMYGLDINGTDRLHERQGAMP